MVLQLNGMKYKSIYTLLEFIMMRLNCIQGEIGAMISQMQLSFHCQQNYINHCEMMRSLLGRVKSSGEMFYIVFSLH